MSTWIYPWLLPIVKIVMNGILILSMIVLIGGIIYLGYSFIRDIYL